MINDLYFGPDLLFLLQILNILYINIAEPNPKLKRDISAQFLSNQISLNHIRIHFIHFLLQLFFISFSEVLQILLFELFLSLLLDFNLLLILIIELFLIVFELLDLILYDIIIDSRGI